MEHRICHFEIPAEDVEKIREFYQNLFGWEIKKDENLDYFLIKTGEGVGGGIMKKENPQQKPANYILVESVDEYTNKIKGLGGQIIMEKQEIPNIGFVALATDPEGNLFGIYEAKEKSEEKTAEESKENKPEISPVTEEKTETQESQNIPNTEY